MQNNLRSKLESAVTDFEKKYRVNLNKQQVRKDDGKLVLKARSTNIFSSGQCVVYIIATSDNIFAKIKPQMDWASDDLPITNVTLTPEQPIRINYDEYWPDK